MRSFLRIATASAVAIFFVQYAFANGTIQEFVLNRCKSSSGTCIKAQAKTAEGSQFKTLFVLSDVIVTLHSSDGTKTEQKSKSGYIDFVNELLVLTPDSFNSEIVYRLDNLTSETWSLK